MKHEPNERNVQWTLHAFSHKFPRIMQVSKCCDCVCSLHWLSACKRFRWWNCTSRVFRSRGSPLLVSTMLLCHHNESITLQGSLSYFQQWFWKRNFEGCCTIFNVSPYTHPEIDSTKTVYRIIIENRHHTSIFEANYYLSVFNMHFTLVYLPSKKILFSLIRLCHCTLKKT